MSQKDELLSTLLFTHITEHFRRLAISFREYSMPFVEHHCRCRWELIDLNVPPKELHSVLDDEEYQQFMRHLDEVESEMISIVNSLTEKKYDVN